MSLSRNVTGREFQRHGPETEKLLSNGNVLSSVSFYYNVIEILVISVSIYAVYVYV